MHDPAPWTLARALTELAAARGRSGAPLRVGLATGFTPLHLQTFVAARLAAATGRAVTIETGLFDDLPQTLQTLGADGPDSPDDAPLDSPPDARLDAVVVALEWPDLDPRLGYRRSHGWRPSVTADVVATVQDRVEALAEAIAGLAGRVPAVSVSLPGLPLPPRFATPAPAASPAALAIRAAVATLGARIAATPNAHVLDADALDRASPPAGRLRLASELNAGFPYHVPHASALAALHARVLAPAPRLKGIITDLDNTLWRGIVGEDGVEGVSWNLDDRSHIHALYQETLAGLGELGILLAVASKNDPAVAAAGLARADLVVPPDKLFPIEASWRPKSTAVRTILEAWNVAADAVMFIDDSPMELAEVAAVHPGIETRRFTPGDDEAILALLRELRERFGSAGPTAEDALRLASLRAGAALRGERAGRDPEAFLRGLGAEIEFVVNAPDARTFELINKTNQFNLNGERLDAGAWQQHVARDDGFVVGVHYRDKFGPLGQIAVVAGRRGGTPAVDHWVMSCRAFSRRIEHATMRFMFDHLGADTVSLRMSPTERNSPLRSFLEPIASRAAAGVVVQADAFAASCPSIHAEIHVR